ncbi:MAG: carbohydrate ABC transporter permease [Anaerolineaceae bacterium]|nr:carbohydrate ABC transporter permease [Anaerolineaceae bacterium]
MSQRTLQPRRLLLYALMLFVLLLYLSPYAYLLLTSLKPPADAIAIPPRIIPETFSLDSYIGLSQNPGVSRAFLNSAVIGVLSTVLALLLAVPAAWAVVRNGSRPGRIFLLVALITRMVPYIAIAIPLFALMRNFHLIDSWFAVSLAHTTISLPLAIWLLAGFLEAIPPELEDAARVDGCSRLSALIRVIIPVTTGGILVTAIFCFLASWNEFLYALLLTSVKAKTAPIVIAEFKTQYGLDWGPMTAIGTLYSLPVILFSLFMQRRIVAGMTMGAVKG